MTYIKMGNTDATIAKAGGFIRYGTTGLVDTYRQRIRKDESPAVAPDVSQFQHIVLNPNKIAQMEKMLDAEQLCSVFSFSSCNKGIWLSTE